MFEQLNCQTSFCIRKRMLMTSFFERIRWEEVFSFVKFVVEVRPNFFFNLVPKTVDSRIMETKEKGGVY